MLFVEAQINSFVDIRGVTKLDTSVLVAILEQANLETRTSLPRQSRIAVLIW